MKQQLNIALGPGECIKAGPSFAGVWLRIEARGGAFIALEMNEYIAGDIVTALAPFARLRPNGDRCGKPKLKRGPSK